MLKVSTREDGKVRERKGVRGADLIVASEHTHVHIREGEFYIMNQKLSPVL